MNKQNEKTIKNFKRRTSNTRHQLHDFINVMCSEAKGGEIEAILLGTGMAPCVAREWGNEHRRRDRILKMNIDKKYRKETSSFGGRGTDYRRIILTKIHEGRRLEFHATKGLRTYWIAA